MSLRYRLFLSVGVLFVLSFIFSLIWENRVTKRDLIKAEQGLRKKILSSDEVKRAHIEQFLALEVSQQMAEVNALLKRISESEKLSDQFKPTENLEKVAENAATLMVFNRWIDFLQNTVDGKDLTILAPKSNAMTSASRVEIAPGISWVLIDDDHDPVIGLLFPMSIEESKKNNLEQNSDGHPVNYSNVYILFSWEKLLSLPKNWKELAIKGIANSKSSSPMYYYWLGDYQVLFEKFFTLIEKAQGYLKDTIKNGTTHEQMQQQLQKSYLALKQAQIETPAVSLSGCAPLEQQNFDTPINDLLRKDNDIVLIWAYSSFLANSEFASTFSSPDTLIGVVRFASDSTEGDGFYIKEVFFERPLFADGDYYNKNSIQNDCWNIAGGTVLIMPPNTDRVFLGNTMKFSSKIHKGEAGYLTLAVSTEGSLKKLALAIQQTCFMVHDDKIILAYNHEGKQISLPERSGPLLEKMLHHQSGEINWMGMEYFFLQATPIKNFDLHYFMLNPTAVEFSVLNDLDKQTTTLLEKISLSMRIAAVIALVIVLLLLHRISRGITRPIETLAGATRSLGKGKLEEVQLPKLKSGRHDEVYTLYNSFAEMVEGMKEKEKVKAVLNKVVSQEIAAEILKGQIHLGGEEKEVTVLFADIRHFTKMTQRMPPKDVIELLNTCMTKISRPIEEHGGVIDKYVGDEIMALFGAPIYKEDGALNAILSALDIRDVLNQWNLERQHKGKESVTMGIGIHTGLVVAGNMGAEDRLNYTVLGSNVNLAARLCGSAQEMQILISKSTWGAPHVKELIIVDEIAPMQFKGFDQAIPVYVVKGKK